MRPLFVLAFLFAAGAQTLFGQTLRLQFGFEDSGTTTTDSVAGVSLNLLSYSNAPTDYHGTNGSGPNGSGRCLNFSATTDYSKGPVAITTNNTAINFGTVTNFTLALWVKPTTTMASILPRIFLLGMNTNTDYGQTNSVGLFHNSSPLTYSMKINTNLVNAPAQTVATNQWIFVAETWDGTNMYFYTGTESNAVTLLGSAPAASGSVNIGSAFNLVLGDNVPQNRSFVGSIDDVRFYTGVASGNFLENVRQQAYPSFSTVPQNVTLTTCSQANLDWSPVAYATGYIIKRSTSSGAETNYATTTINSFIDTSVTLGTTYYYQIVATNSFQVSGVSTQVSGTIQNASSISIATQPTNQTVCSGSTVTFSVVVGGSGLFYQWESSTDQGTNWTTISGATTASYTNGPVTGANSGTLYRVVVSSGCALVTSAAATLTVPTTPATIVAQPFAQTVVAGWPAVFAVQATGTNVLYQWRRNGVNLTDGNGVTGSSSAVLTLTNLTTANSGEVYDCVIGPPCVAVTSSPATLTVNAAPTNNLMLQYGFEDAGNGTISTDAVHGVTLNMVDASFSPADLHSANGSGVGGSGRALDFSSGTMGGTGPLAYVAADSSVNFGTIGSFTLSFWIKPTQSMTGFPRFFLLGPYGTTDSGQAGSLSSLYGFGPLSTYINAAANNSATVPIPTNQWMFVTVTWDGQTMNYYKGSQSGAASLISSVVATNGPVNVGNSYNLLIGNRSDETRSFAGLMDDIRFYLGAAPVTAIETIRQSVLPASSNATLVALSLNPAGALTPGFSSNILSYVATNAWGSQPTLTVTNADLSATNALILNGGFSQVLTSGVPSLPMVLKLGVNPIQVRVTAQDGVTSNAYTVNVTLDPNKAAFKITNSVLGGTNLVLTWPSDHTGFRLLEQTNNLTKGVSVNAADWREVLGAAATNKWTLPLVMTNKDEFYRLVYP